MLNVFEYVKNPNFPQRYVSPEVLHNYLQDNLKDCISEIGKSTLGEPIYMLSLGTGNTKVIAWSQMHGNESTATLAMLDLLSFLDANTELKSKLLASISLDFIFMLNPDGSAIWNRRNAYDIDLNRDYIKESSIEIKVLKKVLNKKDYHYALNLHDQRTLFSAEEGQAAGLSFLAPSENVERTLTENRKKSMAVISGIFIHLREQLAGKIARYSDEFYPTSVGDNLMKAGLPTILFEGGFFLGDYSREKTRKFYTSALFYALRTMAILKGESLGYETYFSIPENKESHFDIIYRNVKFNPNNDSYVDIAVQYREALDKNTSTIELIPYVVEIGDLTNKKGWQDVDCKEKIIKMNNGLPKIDQKVDFSLV